MCLVAKSILKLVQQLQRQQYPDAGPFPPPPEFWLATSSFKLQALHYQFINVAKAVSRTYACLATRIHPKLESNVRSQTLAPSLPTYCLQYASHFNLQLRYVFRVGPPQTWRQVLALALGSRITTRPASMQGNSWTLDCLLGPKRASSSGQTFTIWRNLEFWMYSMESFRISLEL
jgi:hypothetical protein